MDRPRSLVQDAGILNAVHSAAVVSAGGETRRAGPPPPQLGETTPLVDAYSIVRSGAAHGAAPIAAAPRIGQRALGYRRFTGCSNRPVMTGCS